MLTSLKIKLLRNLHQADGSEESGGSRESSSDTNPEHDLHDAAAMDVDRHWANLLSETTCVSGCNCVFCRRRPAVEMNRNRVRRERVRKDPIQTLPGTQPHPASGGSLVLEGVPKSSVMQMLYPTELTTIPSPNLHIDFDPPAYDESAVWNAPRAHHDSRGNRPRGGTHGGQTVRYSPQGSDATPPTPSSGPAERMDSVTAVNGIRTPVSRSGRRSDRVHVRHINAQPQLDRVVMEEEKGQDSPPPPYAGHNSTELSPMTVPPSPDLLGPYPHISLLSPRLG